MTIKNLIKKFTGWILELIGLRKVYRLTQLAEYELNEDTSDHTIREILRKASNKVQFHVGIEIEVPEDSKCGIMLIQRDPLSREFYFVCKTVPFGMTPWERVHITDVVKRIQSTKYSECRHFEKFTLVTRAIEGKAFGEY